MAANWTPISYDDDYLKNKSFTASDLPSTIFYEYSEKPFILLATKVTPMHSLKWLARNPVSCCKPMLLFSLRNVKCTFALMFEQLRTKFCDVTTDTAFYCVIIDF